MYPHNNGTDYDQVIRVENGRIYNKTNVDFVEIIHSYGCNLTDIMTINGTKVNPDDPYGDISYQAYGEIARYKEQIDEAKRAADLNNTYEKDIKIQDEAIRIDPQNETAWTNKGFALYLLNKYDEALASYDKAIEINPKDSDAWKDKGDVLYRLKKYDKAIMAYDKAIELNPKDEAIWYFKGDALRDLGKYDEAQKAYDKAFKRS
jgi:tetratricopeptide (TPR) repeat protein